MEEWYEWIETKPDLENKVVAREKGWLRDLAVNYMLFSEERDREEARLRSGLVALSNQTTHLQRNIHTMRETKRRHEEQVPLLKEKKVRLEKEMEEIHSSLLIIYNAANSRPLDTPEEATPHKRIIDRFRSKRLPPQPVAKILVSPRASPKQSARAQGKTVKRGKPLHPPRRVEPPMSANFPDIPTTTPTLQPLSMIKRPVSGSKTSSFLSRPKDGSLSSNFCRTCSKVEYEGTGRGDALECASCGGKYHMGCLEPPMMKKPPLGYVWTCVDCESGTSSLGEEEELDLEATTKRTRSKTSSLPAAKKTFDEQLEEIETREIVEKFKHREKTTHKRRDSPSLDSDGGE